MKKIIIAVLLLLIIVGAGAPYVSGLMMEKEVKNALAKTNEMYAESGADASVELLQYDRSYSSSQIEVKVDLGSLESIYGIKEIIVTNKAKHGYAGVVSTTSLEKNKWYTDFVANELNGKDPLTITTNYNYSGTMSSTVGVEAFSLMIDGEKIDIQGGKITSSSDKDFTHFTTEASWGGVNIADKLQLDGVSISSDLEMISTYLWDGKFTFGIDKINVTEAGEQGELVNLKGDYLLDVDKGANTISISTGIGLDHFEAGEEKVDNAYVRVGFNDIDGKGFENSMVAYYTMLNKMFQEISGAGESSEEMQEILGQKLMQEQMQLMSVYEQLLKKGLEFEISDLQATLPQGEVKGGICLSLNKDMTFTQFFPLLQQPSLVTEIFSLTSDLSLPAELIGENPMLLSPAHPGMKSGLFVQKDNMLAHKAEIKDGKLFLNDEEVQL